MGKKRIAVAALYANATKFYSEQLKSLFGDYVEVERYCFYDRSIERGIEGDVVLIPSPIVFEVIKKYIKSTGEIIVANRTLSKKGFHEIMELPEGTRGLLVNVSAEMAIETISLIYQLGAKHIELTPVYPGMKEVPDIDVALTPGESQYVPKRVKKIIDIGDRVLDISTITDIAYKLNLGFLLQNENFKRYFNEIVPVSFGLEKIIGKTSRLESQMDILLQILDEGIIGVNSEGMINFYNESAQNILGHNKEDIMGIRGGKIFPQIPFKKVLDTSEAIKEKLINISGLDLVVTVVPIMGSNILHGALAIIRKFSDTEKKQHKLRAQLIGKGHRAKYNFNDIIGTSDKINKCKEIAKRMAVSDSSILIIGESGTGKELFAQAIHNFSPRKDYQFVAVNCAALPESLLESELFGYEEGAFTGARKGGKPGLFELAHMGTLFLDEIGEMPLRLQARLLRVLQEKEVMRVGGDSVINVDVRIITATNRDLEELVKRGEFRRDLYYRLNVLPLKIPPLRERKEDIFVLIEELKREFNSKFTLTWEAGEMFLNHNWRGNVRELRNYIEYLTNLGEDLISIRHLPFESEENNLIEELSEDEKILIDKFKISLEGDLSKYIFILEELEKSYHNKIHSGRRSLEKKAKERGIFLTEQEIRSILLKLKGFSMVEISRGRGGTKITDLGIRTLKYFQMG